MAYTEGLRRDTAHTKFDTVNIHPDENRIRIIRATRKVETPFLEPPAANFASVFDECGSADKRNIGAVGMMLIAKRKQAGASNIRRLARAAPRRKPNGPILLAGHPRNGSDNPDIDSSILGRRCGPAIGHFRHRIPCGGEQPIHPSYTRHCDIRRCVRDHRCLRFEIPQLACYSVLTIWSRPISLQSWDMLISNTRTFSSPRASWREKADPRMRR